jgi:hypothetical protein
MKGPKERAFLSDVESRNGEYRSGSLFTLQPTTEFRIFSLAGLRHQDRIAILAIN